MCYAGHTDPVRDAYEQFLGSDRKPLAECCAPDVVFHIAGDHPLSGDYAGLDEVGAYLATVAEVTGGHGGFTVDWSFTDETGELILVEGTAFHLDGEPFVRTIAHLLRLADGRVVEFWDNPFDQPAEDRFWTSRASLMRPGRSRETSPA
jgi:ketosteroid isomerase-like protein